MREAPEIAPLKRRVADVRAALAARLEGGALRGVDGLALGRAHASALDAIVVETFLAASSAAPVGLEGIALVAVGSHGRGAVALHSDADVRIVTATSSLLDSARRVADAFLYPLWDASLPIGHQVAELSELLALAEDDLATATALLDMRLLAGDRSVVLELERRAWAGLFGDGRLASFFRRLEEELTERHKRFGGSLYLLEPDIKSGAGCMRDLDGIGWAARARLRVGGPGRDAGDPWAEMTRLGVLVGREAAELRAAEELFWRVRNRLHASAGRRADRLTFDQQEAIAVALAYTAPGEPSAEARAEAAERFMQDFYIHARAVSQARSRILTRLAPPTPRRGKPVEIDLGEGARLFDGHVSVDRARIAAEPALALRAYALCVARRAPLHPFTRDSIALLAADPAWASRLRESPEAVTTFVALVTTLGDAPLRAASVLAELHDTGLLLAMIPEFAPVTGHVHHDVYHVYTVDAHSVAAVDCLRALCTGELANARPVASRLAAELTSHRVLFMATLLHDVGKGYPDASGSRRNHSQVGAELCETILRRLAFTPEEVEEVRLLVAQHLAMYHVATRRDLDDGETIAEFCKLVHGRDGLRNLYLLTVVDLSTTSPTALTSWKARMLEELYFAADDFFASGAASAVDARRVEQARERAIAAAAPDMRAEVEAFARTMPDRYLLAHAPSAVEAHAAVARARDGRRAHVDRVPARHPDTVELCVVADDSLGLLARIAAALTANRLDVLAAQVYSRTIDRGDGAREEAVDIFWVRPRSGDLESVDAVLPRLRRDLEALIGGELAPADLLAERVGGGRRLAERPTPAVRTEIVVDDRASPRHTVIEVFAKDRDGMLFQVADAIRALGLTIVLSKINTEGHKVADVFYVSEHDGSKVAPGARFREIRDALLQAVDGAGRGAPREEEVR